MDMSAKLRVVAIGILFGLMASLSALHAHVTPFGVDYDMVAGLRIVGVLTFFIATSPKNSETQVFVIDLYFVLAPFVRNFD
jgi:hypothetical protein